MKILSWNGRGVAAAVTVSELKELCRSFKPPVVFLMETRAKREKLELIARSLRLKEFFCVELSGLSGAMALPAISSDHTPIVFEVEPEERSGKSFKYEIMWNEHQECKSFVSQGWQINNEETSKWKALTKKTANCRRAILRWHNTTFTNASKEIPKLKARLSQLQNERLSGDDWKEVREIRSKLTELWKQEEFYWGLRNVENCLQKIPVLITPEMNSKLNVMVTEEEIKRAVEGLGSTKAPGPDGFNGLFYKSHWETGNKDVLAGYKNHEVSYNCHLQNQDKWALIPKAWRIIQDPNALWVKILKGIYFPNQEFLTAPRRQGSSWIWRSILEGRAFARRNGQWLVAKGSDIRFWEDRWIWSRESLKAHSNGEDLKVADVLDLPNKAWNTRKLKEILAPDLEIKAFQTPIAWFQMDDKLIWPHTASGSYSVKTGYHIANAEINPLPIVETTSTSPPHALWQEIWKLRVPQKVKFFIWRACTNALPVLANLVRRKLPIFPLCPICKSTKETVEHCLLLCQWVSPIWFGSHFQWLPSPMNITRFDIWFTERIHILQQNPETYAHNLARVACILWAIWKQRNNCAFTDIHPQPTTTLIQAANYAAEYIQATETLPQQPILSSLRSSFGRHWKSPPLHTLKCNTDAAWCATRKSGAAAVVVRDHLGSLLFGLARKIPASSPLVAEAIALRDATLMAYNLNWSRVVLESDCLPLIEACRGERSLAEIDLIVRDILSLSAVPDLLCEHIIPDLFTIDYLRKLAFDTKIETLSPGHCITVTSNSIHSNTNTGATVQPSIMRLMFRDTMLRLHSSGFNILALSMKVKYAELITLNNMIAFVVNGFSIFSGPHSYMSNVQFHIVQHLFDIKLERNVHKLFDEMPDRDVQTLFAEMPKTIFAPFQIASHLPFDGMVAAIMPRSVMTFADYDNESEYLGMGNWNKNETRGLSSDPVGDSRWTSNSIEGGSSPARHVSCGNVVSWTSLMTGCGMNGRGNDVLWVFDEMRKVALVPNAQQNVLQLFFFSFPLVEFFSWFQVGIG
ncbi:Ribonuclease H superfamily [Sesbania bispinosa]|nr:Ribonuclease H superfamily [Sesbania bispinosa]